MTNVLATVLALWLNTGTNRTTVSIKYTVPNDLAAMAGQIIYIDTKHRLADDWVRNYYVQFPNPGTNTVTFRPMFADQGFFRLRVAP